MIDAATCHLFADVFRMPAGFAMAVFDIARHFHASHFIIAAAAIRLQLMSSTADWGCHYFQRSH